MRTTLALTLAAPIAAAGLTLTSSPTAHAAESETQRERGIVVECTGSGDGIDAYVNLYENDVYANYVQVVINDDPDLANSREPADIWSDEIVRTSVQIDGKKASIRGTASKVGPRKHVHEEYDDAGQHIVADGFHRRLKNDLVLRFSGGTVPLDCAPAFYYDLQVTKTDTTGD